MHFAPPSFDPPRTAALGDVNVEVLSPAHADQDFAAVSASADSILHVFGPDNGWPDSCMTYADNLADLEPRQNMAMPL
jgi:hypothetical protein